MLRGILSVIALPILCVAPTAVAIYLLETQWPARLPLPAAIATIALYFVVVPPAVILLALLERILPYREDWRQPKHDVGTDTAHLVASYVIQAAGRILWIAIGATLAAMLSRAVGGTLWPSTAPLGLQVLLAVLVADFGHYWFHRLSHEMPRLWRLHATHHSALRLYWLNANRFHVLDILLLQGCSVLPLIILGADEQTFIAYGAYVIVFGHIQHSNVAYRTGWLDYILSTPNLHRYHHSLDPREGNTNYTGDLVIWDLIFGTFHLPGSGHFRGSIGNGLPGFPQTFLAQQLSPFRWRRHESSGARVPSRV